MRPRKRTLWLRATKSEAAPLSAAAETGPRPDAPTGARRADDEIRVLRVIARLNMGGPALHVAYLTAGLAERGYRTTLVAGELSRGEESMAFVADRHGVAVRRVSELHREISPLRDLVAVVRLARLLRAER